MRGLIIYSGLYGGAAALLKLIGFVVILWLVRTLSVDDFALFGLLYAIQQGLSTFSSAGIVEATIGLLKEHQKPEQRARLFAKAHFAFFIMTISALVFALPVFRIFFRDSEISLLGYTTGVLGSGVLLAVASFRAQIIRLEEKHLWALSFNFFPALGGFLGGVAAVFLKRTAEAFFVGSAAGVIVALLGLWVSQAKHRGKAAPIGNSRVILWRAVPFMGVAFLGWLSGYGNNYVIDVLFLPAEVAKFTFLLSLCSIMLLIAGSVNQVWSPRFYRLIHETPFEIVEQNNKRFYWMLAMVLGYVGGFVIIVYPFGVVFLGGNLLAYQSMSLELSLLFAAYVVLTPWWHCQNHFLAHAKGPSILKITLVTSTIGIGIWVTLMFLVGSIGIYLGFFSQMLVRALGIFVCARRIWPVDVSWSGSAIGTFMIFMGFVFSSLGITPTTGIMFYLLLGVVVGIIFLRADFTKLIRICAE